MEGVSDSNRWTLVAVCATTFMLLVDITIVNVALPSVQRQLDASLTGLQWVVDAYAVTLAALILTAGALADRYGRRLVFAAGVVIFTVASFVAGCVERRRARRRARRPRRRRRRAVRDRARADRRRVPGRRRAERDRDLGSDDRLRGRCGTVAWGDHHRLAQLALGLLRQRPGRRVRVRARGLEGSRVARPERAAHRRCRAGLVLGLALPHRLRPPAGERCGVGERADPRARSSAAPRCSPPSW